MIGFTEGAQLRPDGGTEVSGKEQCEGCESKAEYRLEYEWGDPDEYLCGTCLENVVTNFTRSFRYTPDAPDSTKLQVERLRETREQATGREQEAGQ